MNAPEMYRTWGQKNNDYQGNGDVYRHLVLTRVWKGSIRRDKGLPIIHARVTMNLHAISCRVGQNTDIQGMNITHGMISKAVCLDRSEHIVSGCSG
jgi:hypothetical protein